MGDKGQFSDTPLGTALVSLHGFVPEKPEEVEKPTRRVSVSSGPAGSTGTGSNPLFPVGGGSSKSKPSSMYSLEFRSRIVRCNEDCGIVQGKLLICLDEKFNL